MKNKIFLHMGPGFHSLIEEKLFAISFPEVLFWNQPPCSSFSELMRESGKVLTDAFSAYGKPIGLKAHSFGAQIAIGLLRTHPQMIKNITLLNSSFDPFECFLNLSPLTPEAKSLLNAESPHEKLNFIFSIATQPDFSEKYWIAKERKQNYDKLAANYPSLNIETFSQVFKSYLDSENYRAISDLKNSKPNSFFNFSWPDEVKIIASQHDQLIKKNDDTLNWLKIFPEAKVNFIENSGHFSLFEDENIPTQFFSE